MGSHVVSRIERYRLAHHRVAPLRYGTQTVFSDLYRDIHGFFVALWNRAESAISPHGACDSRRRRWRVATYGSVNSGGHLFSGRALFGFFSLRSHGGMCPGPRTPPRRMAP